MPRAGLTVATVVAAAAHLADREGFDAVTPAAVARTVGVRTPSLYAHVDGADGLRRALAVRALDALADRVTSAAIGRSGADAVAGIIRAYCAFADEEPGLYDATLLPPGDDPELGRAMASVGRPLNLVFASYGLDETEALHWYRIVFSAVHGFSGLRRDGLLTMPADPDETLDRMVALFARELAASVTPG